MRQVVAWASVLLLAFLPALPLGSGHPYHLLVANEGPDDSVAVHSEHWVAQSFWLAEGADITRVSLYLLDEGAPDVASVSIRANNATGLPGAASLASASVRAGSAPAWVDVDFEDPVALEDNTTYWIVLSSARKAGSGYRWWRADGPTAPGLGANSTDGLAWTETGEVYALRVHGFRQPDLRFAVTREGTSLAAGATTNYTVRIDNLGRGTAARAWVNVSLPPQLAYMGDDVGDAGGTLVEPYVFAFQDLAPGDRSFRLTLKASGGMESTGQVSIAFRFEATDHNGVPTVATTQTEILTVEGESPISPWIWMLGGVAAVAGALAFGYLRPKRASIEEVFVVHQNGVLLAHRSKSLTPDKDADILASMLKAVQDFVRHSFAEHEDAPVRSLEFGEYRILIENEADYYVAVVYRGVDDGSVAKGLDRLTRRIHEAYGATLAGWDGDMKAIQGLKKLLPCLWEERAERSPSHKD